MSRLFLVLSLIVCSGAVAEAQRLSPPVLAAKKLSGGKVRIGWRIDRQTAGESPTLRLFRSVEGGSYLAKRGRVLLLLT
jgi:hypothetical protein